MTTFTQILSKKGYDKGEIRNITLFAMGKLVSVFGSAIYTFAIGLYVLQLTESGLSFALTIVLGTIPMVIMNPFAGVLADRMEKKKLVVSMDFANGLLFIMVYLFSSFLGLQLAMIYVSTFFMSIFTTVFGISLEIAKPNIVTQKNLMNINAISKIIDSVSSILGPMVGGMVFILMDIRLFILMNGLSFILSGISEMFIDFNYNMEIQTKGHQRIKFTDDLKEGFNYIRATKWLTGFIGAFVCLNFFIGLSITIPLPFIINNVLLLSSSYYGIIQGGFPIGMIIGAFMVKKVSERMTCHKLLRITSIFLSASMVLIGLPVLSISSQVQNHIYLIYYSLISVMIGCLIALIDIQFFYELQTIIPEEYRGRVLSIGIAIAKAVLPIGLIISGIFINRLPPGILPITGGIALFTVSKVMFEGRTNETMEKYTSR
ncbi:MAG: MFS transporter [Thermotaleaceae bacterium]